MKFLGKDIALNNFFSKAPPAENYLEAAKAAATIEVINNIAAQQSLTGPDDVSKALNVPMGENLRPSLDALNQMSNPEGMKQPIYPISPHLLFELPKYSDILRIVMTSKKSEVFRNGIEIERKFKWKCESCGEEYDDERDEDGKCDLCGGVLREPDHEQKKIARALVEGIVNLNNQRLRDVLDQNEDDVNIIDDMYLANYKDYGTNEAGEIVEAEPKEIVRINPLFIRFICDKTGIPGKTDDGKEVNVCPFHRDTPVIGDRVCTTCGSKAYPVHFVVHAGGFASVGSIEPHKKIYYMEGEVFHASRYRKSLTYGWPPTIPIWQKTVTLMNMDRYIKEYYHRQRPPKDLLLINTRNVDSLQKSWEWLLDQTRRNPHIPQPLAVESPQTRGNFAQHINLMDTLSDMQYIETRNEFRRQIGAIYGVMPLFSADMSTSGGLNNEGLQVTVTNRAIDAAQSTYNEELFPWLCDQYQITDWRIFLPPSEEKDEMHDLQLEAQKINNAMQMRALGFKVERNADSEFTYEKDENAELEPFGLPRMPGHNPEKPKQVEGAAGEQGMQGRTRFEGEPPAEERAKSVEKFADVEKAVDEVNLEVLGYGESAINKATITHEIMEKIEKALFERRFEGLTWKESNKIKDILIRAFREGTAMSEVIKEVATVSKKVTEYEAERIVRTENQAIRNTAREHTFKQGDPQGKKRYKWLGPSDKRTTKICEKIKERTAEGVSLEKLRNIIREEATKAGFDSREWTPHINCRHTFVRAF